MKLPTREELEKRYSDYSDDQLMDILKHGKDYQSLAVDVIRKMAEQRGLSCTEEISSSVVAKKRFFPLFNNLEAEDKMFHSLMRILYLFTIIPVVLTILSYARNAEKEFFIWGLFSAGWILSVVFLTKYKSKIWALVLYIIYLFSVTFGVMSFGIVYPFTMISLAIYIIAFLIMLYVLSYVFVLLCREKGPGCFL